MWSHSSKVLRKYSTPFLKFNSFKPYQQNFACFSTQNEKKNDKANGSNDRQSSSKSSIFGSVKTNAFLLYAGIAGGILGYFVFGREEKQIKQQTKGDFSNQNNSQSTKLGGQWKLLNTDSKVFSSEDLKGSYYLIYFGYALCPDICPTTLNYLSNVNRHLKKTEQGKVIDIKIVFVSVDPQRDTPQRIKNYLALFDSSIIGLTGRSQSDEDYKSTLASFKVYANKISASGQNGYNIDHTSIVFLMDPNSRFIGSINPSKTEKQTAQFIINKVKDHKESNSDQ